MDNNIPNSLAFAVNLGVDGWCAECSGRPRIVSQGYNDIHIEDQLYDAISTHYSEPYSGGLTIRIGEPETINTGLSITRWLLCEAVRTLRKLSTDPNDYSVEIAGLLDNLVRHLNKTGDIV